MPYSPSQYSCIVECMMHTYMHTHYHHRNSQLCAASNYTSPCRHSILYPLHEMSSDIWLAPPSWDMLVITMRWWIVLFFSISASLRTHTKQTQNTHTIAFFSIELFFICEIILPTCKTCKRLALIFLGKFLIFSWHIQMTSLDLHTHHNIFIKYIGGLTGRYQKIPILHSADSNFWQVVFMCHPFSATSIVPWRPKIKEVEFFNGWELPISVSLHLWIQQKTPCGWLCKTIVNMASDRISHDLPLNHASGTYCRILTRLPI